MPAWPGVSPGGPGSVQVFQSPEAGTGSCALGVGGAGQAPAPMEQAAGGVVIWCRLPAFIPMKELVALRCALNEFLRSSRKSLPAETDKCIVTLCVCSETNRTLF